MHHLSLKLKNTPNNGNTRDVETIAPLKYFSNFGKTLEIPLINCEVNLILTQSLTFAITNSTGEVKFALTVSKLYVPVETLSIQDNTRLLRQLKSGFKRIITWNKYQSDPKAYAQNRYLNHLSDPSFQRGNKLFLLSFENEDDRRSHSRYYLPKVEIKDQGGDYTTGFLLDYPYFKVNHEFEADPGAIQQINFTANLNTAGNTTMFFIIEEAKETVLGFSLRTVKVL